MTNEVFGKVAQARRSIGQIGPLARQSLIHVQERERAQERGLIRHAGVNLPHRLDYLRIIDIEPGTGHSMITYAIIAPPNARSHSRMARLVSLEVTVASVQ